MGSRETIDHCVTPMEITWQFDYDIDLQKLRTLYSKSKQCQWDAEVDIDWSIDIDPSKPLVDAASFRYDELSIVKKMSKSQKDQFTAHSAAHLLSQFLHGEQGALMTSAALTHAVPDYEGKLYAAQQTADEARHVEVYERYIRKLAIVYPISPWLKDTIDTTLRADHWVKIAIGMNMVVEGLALAAFHNMRRSTHCDLLRQITERVLRDESRHVAFGNLYVGATIATMHEDDREDVAQFAFEVVKLMADSMGGPNGDKSPGPDPGFLQMLEACNIDLMDFVASLQEASLAGIRADMPAGQVHSFKDLMMPALVRVGAVTPRSRELFEKEGIPVWDDLTVLESMEDAGTGDIDFSRAPS